MNKAESWNVLEGILAAFDAGLRFGVSIQSTEYHLDLGLNLRQVRLGLFELHVSLATQQRGDLTVRLHHQRMHRA
jgi:hypothetical protein